MQLVHTQRDVEYTTRMSINLTVTTVLILAICVTGMFQPISIDSHNGAMIVDTGGAPAFAINGLIWGGYSDHEFGHVLQQDRHGDNAYYAMAGLSVASNVAWLVSYVGFDKVLWRVDDGSYFRMFPWESEADQLAKEYLWQ